MLYRKAYDRLLEWKGQPNKKALCIMGARQTGKTTVIRQFGKEQYPCFVEVNFITDTDAAKIFSGNLDANTIIAGLTAYTRKPMIPGNTLVLLEEIPGSVPTLGLPSSFWWKTAASTISNPAPLLGVRTEKCDPIRSALRRFIRCILWIWRNICGPTAYRNRRFST